MHPIERLRYGRLLETASGMNAVAYFDELGRMNEVTVTHKARVYDRKNLRYRRKSRTFDSNGTEMAERIDKHIGHLPGEEKRVEIRKRSYGTIVDYSNQTRNVTTRDIYIIRGLHAPL